MTVTDGSEAMTALLRVPALDQSCEIGSKHIIPLSPIRKLIHTVNKC